MPIHIEERERERERETGRGREKREVSFQGVFGGPCWRVLGGAVRVTVGVWLAPVRVGACQFGFQAFGSGFEVARFAGPCRVASALGTPEEGTTTLRRDTAHRERRAKVKVPK